MVRGEKSVCGDRLFDWVCSLEPGTHANWLHVDERVGSWWSQSRFPPYSNAASFPGEAPCSTRSS